MVRVSKDYEELVAVLNYRIPRPNSLPRYSRIHVILDVVDPNYVVQ